MCSQTTLQEILRVLQVRLVALLGASMREIILFGSYARNEADDGSDIDVMILCDLSRTDIATLHWQLGEIASDILLAYGVLLSPIIENHRFFNENAQILPFYRNIRDEGVRIGA